MLHIDINNMIMLLVKKYILGGREVEDLACWLIMLLINIIVLHVYINKLHVRISVFMLHVASS